MPEEHEEDACILVKEVLSPGPGRGIPFDRSIRNNVVQTLSEDSLFRHGQARDEGIDRGMDMTTGLDDFC
jgi:hypothetical protein